MTALTANFTLEEFETEGAIPSQYLGNVAALATLLESARSAGGDFPLRITSGYRNASGNAAAGGVSGSQHLTASAADFAVEGEDGVTWAEEALVNGLPAFGQLILYPWSDGHVHLSLPGGHHNQVLVEVGTNQYAAWNPGDTLPPWGSLQPAGHR